MYRHLFVPIDASDLSVEVVGHAIALARTLSARITYFHAVPVEAGGPPRVPDRAGELLTKAQAAARAYGVPCDARRVPCDDPARGIVDSAQACGCDLIIIAAADPHAAPGARQAPLPGAAPEHAGSVFNTGTLHTLIDSGLPLLVSSIGSPCNAPRALRVILDEHRALAAVLHAWMSDLARAREQERRAELPPMRAALEYLRHFAGHLNHPKENGLLFPRLRERNTACHAELDELQRQHARDLQLIDELAAHLDALAAVPADADAEAAEAALRLETELGRYARFQWEHMGREEGVILPAARQHLRREDWQELDAAFSPQAERRAHDDADAGVQRLLAQLTREPAALRRRPR